MARDGSDEKRERPSGTWRVGAPLPRPLVVGPNARWLELPCGKRLELLRQRAMRLILLALAQERVAAPGHALSSERLLERGWPEERVTRESGRLRVRVTLSRLRALGLHDLIASRDDGYLIRPETLVVLEGAAPHGDGGVADDPAAGEAPALRSSRS